MDRSYFFNGQFVTASDLNNTEATKASQSILRTQAPLGNSGGIGGGVAQWTGSVVKGGVYGSPADYLDTASNLYANPVSANQFVIALGKALSPQGELIVVPVAKSVSRGEFDSNFRWTTAANLLNYVKLRYAETSGSLRADRNGVSHYTEYLSSYYVSIDSTFPNSTELLLAVFLADANGDIFSFADRRTYTRLVTPADAIVLNPLTLPIGSNYTTLEDHITATGSAAPSATNPHGISYADIGAAPSGSVVVLIPSTGSTIGYGTTYQNVESNTIFVSAVINISDQGSLLNNSVSLYTSSTGSAGSPGSLSGTTIELARVSSRFFIANLGNIEPLYASVAGFIPKDWFYRISLTTGASGGSGSVISSIRYI